MQDKKRALRAQSSAATATAAINAAATGTAPAAGTEPAQPKLDTVADVVRHIEHFARLKVCAISRKERAEELMARRIARSWSPAKKAQMVRRLMVASQEVDQSVSALEQLQERLQQLGAQHRPVAGSANFVPPPPTSA